MPEIEALRSDYPGGDIGPCDHYTCEERATAKVLLDIAGVRTFVYVCDDHEAVVNTVEGWRERA